MKQWHNGSEQQRRGVNELFSLYKVQTFRRRCCLTDTPHHISHGSKNEFERNATRRETPWMVVWCGLAIVDDDGDSGVDWLYLWTGAHTCNKSNECNVYLREWLRRRHCCHSMLQWTMRCGRVCEVVAVLCVVRLRVHKSQRESTFCDTRWSKVLNINIFVTSKDGVQCNVWTSVCRSNA